MMKYRWIYLLLITLCIGAAYGCDAVDDSVETLVPLAQMPSTERGALAMDNRFFFIGGKAIYELLTQPDGTRDYEVVAQREDCDFTGLAAADTKLYAACTATGFSTEMAGQTLALPAWSDLVRVDLLRPASDPARIAATRLGDGKMLPNGMAVDDKGDIYISNTFSMIFRILNLFSPESIPAILRVRVTDEEDRYTIEKRIVLPALQGGMTPNGIQIRGDRLWFVSMNKLFETRIGSNGLSKPQKLYQAKATRMFDDFAVLPDNILAVAEFPTPMSLMSIFFPNTWPPSNDPSQLTFVSTGAGPDDPQAGRLVQRHILAPGIVPSSATYLLDAQGPALYVTDFFFGGLYRVAIDQ